jgi:hypothetical protein
LTEHADMTLAQICAEPVLSPARLDRPGLT